MVLLTSASICLSSIRSFSPGVGPVPSSSSSLVTSYRCPTLLETGSSKSIKGRSWSTTVPSDFGISVPASVSDKILLDVELLARVGRDIHGMSLELPTLLAKRVEEAVEEAWRGL